MADFSLTTLFVVPIGQTALPIAGSTQNLSAGEVGIFRNDYTLATAGNIAAAPYFYIAQGRTNTYLQGSKRSDKIKGCPSGSGCSSNVTEWYKVAGCPTPITQITDVGNWNVQCGDIVTITLRAHSSYLDTLYFNGFTRSITVNAPCCDCGGDPCTTVDVPALIDDIILHFLYQAPGNNPDNITFSDFYQFQRIGNDQNAFLRITGKPLTKYGQPCDVAAFPFEYDRMWFRTFVYSGPATTADFIVADNCNIVADPVIVQRSSYAVGTSAEIAQLEKNFYSYQAGYLKHLYRMGGYNENFESWVNDGTSYDTYYIKFNEYNKSEYQWGDYIMEDSTVIIAAESGSAIATAIETVLEAGLGTVTADNLPCITTTSTTTTIWPSTTTTSTLIP
tara:strand:+ start:12165 stop:13337 length:1173 start_codon:yes stop_codon:yes gene_type:complete